MALAGLGALPARQQQADLLVAADQRRQAAPRGRLEAARRAGRLAHPVDRDRLLDPLDHVRAALLEDEQALDQPPRALADHDGAGLGQPLQAGGDVRGLADHRHLVAELAGADVADHDEAGVDADPDVDADAEALELAVEALDRLDDVEPGADRAQRVVLVRLGIAEIGQDARRRCSCRRGPRSARRPRRSSAGSAACTSCRSSGSRRVESAVEPTMSQNITVSWRRSASWRGPRRLGAAGVGGGWPVGRRRGRRGALRAAIARSRRLRSPSETPELDQIGLGQVGQDVEVDVAARRRPRRSGRDQGPSSHSPTSVIIPPAAARRPGRWSSRDAS